MTYSNELQSLPTFKPLSEEEFEKALQSLRKGLKHLNSFSGEEIDNICAYCEAFPKVLNDVIIDVNKEVLAAAQYDSYDVMSTGIYLRNFNALLNAATLSAYVDAFCVES